ncbi:GPI-GlcNAc transferase complex, PIG-H component-domain-containing protein [Nemania sp. FL0916]|nr:GPI-GlcNAc transferase complex, PIG-H component-domain-containing protein [Nemania sp. FL0916]
MLTTAPYLRIRRPSPTAVEFTVSTLPPLTPALRLSLYGIYLLQALLSAALLLVLYAVWAESPYGTYPYPNTTTASPSSSSPLPMQTEPQPETQFKLAPLLAAILSSPPGQYATHLSQTLSPNILIPVCILGLYLLSRRLHTTESLLVLRGLGIQTRSTRDSVLAGSAATRFIPTSKIQDVLVNEAFRGFEVRYYLVVVVEGEADVVVVFPKLLPRAKVVERVWRGVRECLYLTANRGEGMDGKS